MHTLKNIALLTNALAGAGRAIALAQRLSNHLQSKNISFITDMLANLDGEFYIVRSMEIGILPGRLKIKFPTSNTETLRYRVSQNV